MSQLSSFICALLNGLKISYLIQIIIFYINNFCTWLTCQTTCTVKYILIECRTFAVIRKRFFKVNNLTDLFENVKIDDILSFLRETELYQKYDNLKLVNLVQTNEILLIENSTYLNIRFEIFGWICMYI